MTVRIAMLEVCGDKRTAMSVVFGFAAKTVSEANSRDDWRKKAHRTKVNRHAAKTHAQGQGFWLRAALDLATPARPLVVTCTRVAPGRGLDPHENLPASLKAVVDGLADAFGLKNDRDPRVSWQYAQRSGRPREYAVEVRIEAAS